MPAAAVGPPLPLWDRAAEVILRRRIWWLLAHSGPGPWVEVCWINNLLPGLAAQWCETHQQRQIARPLFGMADEKGSRFCQLFSRRPGSIGMREFESSHSSQPVRSLVFSRCNALEGLQIRAFLHALLSLRFPDANQNSILGRKVSRVFSGNGRVVESKVETGLIFHRVVRVTGF